MKKIPRTFCVTLKETPLRTKLFMEEAEKSGLQVTPFYGVLGSRIKLASKLPNELECPGRNVFTTEGAVGCYLSHFILWNVLLHLPDEEFLIVEDDAVFVDGFKEKFLDTIQRVPADWDMVYVGWLPCDGDTPSIPVDSGISIRKPSATHAYVIKKQILQKAIETVQPSGSPIDLIVASRLLPLIKFYVFDPPLVTQRSYMNSSNSTWTSLVYDWKNDLYGVKRKIIKDIGFRDGWHNPERNNLDFWRWSESEFNIQFPKNTDGITIKCSTPIDNEIVFTVGTEQKRTALQIGDNSIFIETKNVSELTGKLKTPFFPSKHDAKSTDLRELGICLKHIIIRMGINSIDIPISDLISSSLKPINFKL